MSKPTDEELEWFVTLVSKQTDEELEWFVARDVMGMKRPAGSSVYHGDWGYTTNLDTIAQAETKIAEMGLIYDYEHKLTILYFSKGGRQNPKMSVVLATPRQRCEAMYAIREHIIEARK